MPRTTMPDPMSFDRFVLTVEAQGSVYLARAGNERVELPAWRGDVTIEAVGDQPEQGGDGVSRDVRRRSKEDGTNLVRAGGELFDWIFRERIGEVFREAMARARASNRGVTLCIELDEAPELTRLPWEILWDTRERIFLSEHPNLIIVRTLKKASAEPCGLNSGRPLQLWALVPEPEKLAKLSVMKEWKRIEEKLRPLKERGLLDCEKLDPPTLTHLGQRFQSSRCDVLHVAAHGELGAPGEMGVVFLENENGRKEKVSGVDLAATFGHTGAPRLVVLNACHGAQAQLDEAYDGLAQHLLRRGVAAVVAMRSSISDQAAVRFATSFYGHLARGLTVELAMIRARQEFSTSPERREQAIPVLYLGADHIRLVDPLPAPRRHKHWALRILLAALLSGLGLLVWWSFSPGGPFFEPDLCPPPPGVEGLRFVHIQSGSVELDGEMVGVREFCIGTHEVSRKIWLEVTGEERPRNDWLNDSWPITDVTPLDAMRFMKKLNAIPGSSGHRLPTQAEWEWAARAGSKTRFFFGDDESELDQYGNCRNFFGKDCHDGPAPVGSFKPNDWGLYDVHGNVSEWVMEVREQEEFLATSDELLATEAEVKDLRLGGSFENVSRNCSFKHRSSVVRAATYQGTGFRVVRELGGAQGAPDPSSD